LKYIFYNFKLAIFIVILLSVISCINPNYNKVRELENSVSIDSIFNSIQFSEEHKAEIIKISSLEIGENTYVATIDSLGKILVRKLELGSLTKPKLLFNANFNDSKSVIALSPNFQYVAINRNRKTEVIEVFSKKKIIQTYAVRALVKDLKFESTSLSLLIASADSHVYRYKFLEASKCNSLKCQNFLERYTGHAGVVSVVSHLNNNPVFFSGDWEGRVIVWKFFDSELENSNFSANLFSNRFFSRNSNNVQFRKRDADAITIIEFNSSNNLVAIGFRSGFAEIWKIRGMEKLARFKAQNGAINSLSFSDNNLLFSTSDKTNLSIWLTNDILNKEEQEQKVKAFKELSDLELLTAKFVNDYDLLVLDKEKKIIKINFRGLYLNE
jgi:WD40 repeat protein